MRKGAYALMFKSAHRSFQDMLAFAKMGMQKSSDIRSGNNSPLSSNRFMNTNQYKRKLE